MEHFFYSVSYVVFVFFPGFLKKLISFPKSLYDPAFPKNLHCLLKLVSIYAVWFPLVDAFHTWTFFRSFQSSPVLQSALGLAKLASYLWYVPKVAGTSTSARNKIQAFWTSSFLVTSIFLLFNYSSSSPFTLISKLNQLPRTSRATKSCLS